MRPGEVGGELRLKRYGDRWEPEFGIELPGGHVAKPLRFDFQPRHEEFYSLNEPVRRIQADPQPRLGDELMVRGGRRQPHRATVELDLGAVTCEIADEDLDRCRGNPGTVRLVPATWWVDDALHPNCRSTLVDMGPLERLAAEVEETCALAR